MRITATRTSSVLVLLAITALAACRNAPEDRGTPANAELLRSAPVNSAAERTERAERTPCEISFEQTKAALAASPAMEQPAPAGQQLPKIELAPRDVYLRDCEQMPRKVQECLVFEYAMKHEAECEQARAEYDDARTVPASAKADRGGDRGGP
jgi:hypothetical protein